MIFCVQSKSAVRASPRFTSEGAPPLLGSLGRPGTPEADAEGFRKGFRRHSRWLFTGLGTRGLLYHALMAEMLVAAIRADDESLLLPVLRRWQGPR